MGAIRTAASSVPILRSNVHDADLSQTNLRGAHLVRATLRNANLTDAAAPIDERLKHVIGGPNRAVDGFTPIPRDEGARNRADERDDLPFVPAVDTKVLPVREALVCG